VSQLLCDLTRAIFDSTTFKIPRIQSKSPAVKPAHLLHTMTQSRQTHRRAHLPLPALLRIHCRARGMPLCRRMLAQS
jgi:hypothetical protein